MFLLSFLHSIMDNWELVASHELNEYSANKFKKDYDQFYKKHRKSRFYETNTQWMPW